MIIENEVLSQLPGEIAGDIASVKMTVGKLSKHAERIIIKLHDF